MDAIIPDCKTFPDISILQDLPYLGAFVKEGLRRHNLHYLSCDGLFQGLRLYGAAPSLLERVVPDSSAKTAIPEAFDLMGYALPPGTLVATQAWSAHRNSAVFPSPESFLPERWLGSGDIQEQFEAMNRHMMPFGTGSRVCGGQNLAQMVLRIAISAIARNFDVISPPETTETTMEMRDSFVRYRVFPSALDLERLTFICALGYLPGVNDLSSDLQPAQGSINPQIGTTYFPTLFFTLIL